MAYNHKALGLRIAQYRKLNHMRQAELAEKCNLSRGYLANLEMGKGQSMSMTGLSEIANALHVTADDLLIDSLTRFTNKINFGQENPVKTKIAEHLLAFSISQLVLYDRIVYEFSKYKGLAENSRDMSLTPDKVK